MPGKNIQPTSLDVEVLNVKGEAIRDAKVTLRPTDSKAKAVTLGYDDRTTIYVAKEVLPGSYEVEVSHGRLEGHSRVVTVGVAPSRELFILGERGSKTYFREKVRVPVDADPDLFAVTIDRKARRDRKFLEGLAANLRLEPEKVPELAEKAGVHLFRLRGANAQEAVARLSEHPLIEHAGAVVSMREHGFSHLTREIVVRFRGPRAEAVAAIAREYGCTVVRELVYAPHTWVLRWNKPATLEILDTIEKIAARDDVEWAEPSLVVTPEVDSITPNDFLWPGLWDRQLIGAQDAWQHLQDAALDTFGDPDILFAVWDSGVQSSGGAPTNDDFDGTLSNGAAKVLAAFDFDNMVANNDNPWSNHGSGVAGVSVALANNPAPVMGQTYGVVGSAPNVQIMTLVGRTPYVDIEVADQYIWMAGFDPQSPLAGFPAATPPRGADVITCSLTPGAGAPLSGTARATLDFVTTFGRGGKGTMCFFSTGNQNQNNVTARPYGAYEKCFGIAGTSFADDGVTEIRAPFSGFGQIALCSPTQDQLGTVHNPPTGFMPWSAAHLGAGNLISYATAQTTVSAAAAAGANTLSVASVAGFAAGGVIYLGGIGVWGSEPSMITAVNAMTNTLTLNAPLLNAHAAGDVVMTGPAGHRNNFGGTSSATPLCAGVAALVLSANPALTYIEARQILRDTAVKFDLANADPVGQWLDANGNPSVMSGLPPVKSGWYGYGRVNAAAAVQTALTFPTSRDLAIRDNLADTGAVASAGAFWNSPDIWCRRLSPGMDPGALPANYATAGPHQDPMRGQSNWVYARVRNNGTDASLDAWVRISITHWPGTEFIYPDSFQPTNGPGDPLPSPMTTGTYFIGEAKVTGLAPGADQIVNVEWPAGLIPPETVMMGMSIVEWHPCLLVEVTPHDGPTPTGNHVWDDNNLAQKNITIVGTDAGQDFRTATVIGNERNPAEYLLLEINRGRLPKEVQLYVNLLDPLLRRRLRTFDQQWKQEPTPAGIGEVQWMISIAARKSWRIGWYQSQEVVFLLPQPKVRVPVVAGKGRITPLVVGGIVGQGAPAGVYEVVLIQRQPNGQISGSATLQVTIGRVKP
ncbi:MAG: S8 family serine peptidase [Acidobacteria bacterium]|nr:S8 family serine peptidase [Acidobacteriota bacterium]